MPEKNATKRASRNSAPSGAGQAHGAAGAKVDQIREIIFGSQMEEYEQRFAALEKRLIDEAARLRTDLTKRLDDYAARINSKIDDEHKERDRSSQQLAGAIQKVTDSLDSRASNLGEQLTAIQQAILKQLGQEADARRKELEKARSELVALIENRADHLLQRKADRAQLAKLLTNVASKLADEQPSSPKSTKRRA